MILKDFVHEQEVLNFYSGITNQITDVEYTEDVLNEAVKTISAIVKRADTMHRDEASSYITTCLGLYIIESFRTADNLITDIEPK